MRNQVGALVGADDVGGLVLDLLTGSLAPTTYINYGTGMRRFTIFATKRASPRYKLPRPICFVSQHGSPEMDPSRPIASNPTLQRSTNSSSTTLGSR
jgi:hypothetical protein